MDGFIVNENSMCIISAIGNHSNVRVWDDVEESGDGCIRNSSISRIGFASGCDLRRIGSRAFEGCRNLNAIEIPASVEEIGDKCFENSPVAATMGTSS